MTRIERVHQALKSKQVGQRDLARHCNVPQTAISRWLRLGTDHITIAQSKELIAAWAAIKAERKQKGTKVA